MGRRPMRSENRPQMGAKTNCMAENEDISRPSNMPRKGARSLPGKSGPNSSSPYSGNNGSTMPKPSRSMNTTKKTIKRADREADPPGSGGEEGDDGEGGAEDCSRLSIISGSRFAGRPSAHPARRRKVKIPSAH